MNSPGWSTPIPAATTKERILDAAERSFARQGIGATSLRSITDEAGVNAAAIHYHFGSKEALLEAVLLRRLQPLRQEQEKRLEQLSTANDGSRLPTPDLLRAFLEPLVALRVEMGERTASFGRMMAWLHLERDSVEEAPRMLGDQLERFASAACVGRDDLGLDEATERFEYALGAATHLVHHAGPMNDAAVVAGRLDRLIDFLAGALETPGTTRPGTCP